MIDRGGAGAAVGQRLLEHAEVLFGWWHWVRDGTWVWATCRRYMRWLRESMREELMAGARCACPKTAATCQELLKVEVALWTFVRVPGLEPTNNAAEVRSVDQKPSVTNSEDWSIGERRKLLAT